jgi:signal transduction histidine kinase
LKEKKLLKEPSELGKKHFWQTIEGRLIGLLLGFGLLLIFFVSLATWQNRIVLELNHQNIKVASPITNASRDVLIGLGMSHRHLQRYVMIYSNDSTIQETIANTWKNQIEPSFNTVFLLRNAVGNQRGEQLIDSIKIYLNKYRLSQINIMRAYRRGAKLEQGIDSAFFRSFTRHQIGLDSVTQVANAETIPTDTKLRTLLAELVKSQEEVLNNNLQRLSKDVTQTNRIVLISLILGLFGLAFAGYLLTQYIKKAIQNLNYQLIKLAEGDLPQEIAHQNNELDSVIGATNQLTRGLQKASDFALQIGKGNFASRFELLGEKDRLGNALLQMRKQLQLAAQEDQQQNWITKGYAKMSDVIRKNNDNLENLSYKFLIELIDYLNFNQGGLFLVETENDEQYLTLTASYAYNRKKHLQKRVKLNAEYAENLLGQVFLERSRVYLSDVPQDYLRITSGLGEANPNYLLLIPLQSNEVMEGVLEIASFQPIAPYQIEFIERICETLAAAIHYVKINNHTQKLLREAQMQQEALLAQEEEMRQNLEELQATQENMHKAQADLQKNEAKLSALINNTMDSIICIDQDYKVLVINQVLKNRYKGTNYEGIDVGANVMDYLGSVKDEWKVYYDRALGGESFDFTIKSTVNTEDSYRHYYFNPIKNEAQVIIGASVFSRDITQQRRQEMANEATIAELQKQLAEAKTQLVSIENKLSTKQ